MVRTKEPNPKTRQAVEERLRVAVIVDTQLHDAEHYAWVCEQLDHLCGSIIDPVVVTRYKGDHHAQKWAAWNWYLYAVHYPTDKEQRPTYAALEDCDSAIILTTTKPSKDISEVCKLAKEWEIEYRIVRKGEKK